MSYKNSQLIARQASISSQPLISPAKARKLENVMRGMSQHGITSIGFGNDAPVQVNDLYPMDISKSIPEEKDIDEYSASYMVNKMSMRNRRRSSSTHSNSVHDSSSRDSLSGRKRRGNEVPLKAFGNLNKRHCPDNMMNVDEDHNNKENMDNNNNNNFHHQLNKLQNDKNVLMEELNLCKTKNNSLNIENGELKKNLSSVQIELNKTNEVSDKYEIEKSRNNRACVSLKKLLDEIAISEKRERETLLMQDNKKIGRVVQHSSNFQVSDIWEDGQLFDDLKKRRKELTKEKEESELKKKELRKLKAKRQKELQQSPAKKNKNKNNDHFVSPKQVKAKKFDDLAIESEIIAIRSASIKKQLNELDIEEQQLQHRKKLHIKFIRLMREEKKSQFSINRGQCCSLGADKKNPRYVLTNLLGRGGFSEVHRAYDLYEHKYVALKIHQLNTHWSEERKKNYTKHATREYDIHKSLSHKCIVSLYDVFGIDVNSFCTVLEYCDGMDLDIYLKMNKILNEKESRSLIIQVFSGLKYLHNQTSPGPIIHYDLKPGNLLYKSGSIKLTDFGLAKIMNQNTDQIELTSQGAGTYWYLPPECFRMNNHNDENNKIMISPKVDIWSTGVIFYQMLFGKRPFGDSLSQDTILNNKTILNARNVYFPNQPKNVSQSAKDFILQCLAYDPKLRLSSNQIVDNHPYFAYLRR